jgi:hypothetical protein
MVSDATGNVFVQGSHSLYVHRLGTTTGTDYGWIWIQGISCSDLVTNVSGNVFVLSYDYQNPGRQTVYQISPGWDAIAASANEGSWGSWSTGSPWTPVLGNATFLAATPNGTLFAVGTDGVVRSSQTGQSGTWQTAYVDPLQSGVYTLAVTPNGVVYALTYGGHLVYSTTGLPNSWQEARFVAPGRVVTSGDVHGLANGRDGQVYFLAGGNVYQILGDGIGTVVRAQISAQAINGISFDQALNRVGVANLMARVGSYLQQLDGTDATAQAVVNRVAQLLQTNTAQVNILQLIQDGAKVAKDGITIISDIASENPAALLDFLQITIDVTNLINDC